MQPREQSREQDSLFRSSLDQIVSKKHKLARMVAVITCTLPDQKLGEVLSSRGGQFVLAAKALLGNPHDAHILSTVIPHVEAIVGNEIKRKLGPSLRPCICALRLNRCPSGGRIIGQMQITGGPKNGDRSGIRHSGGKARWSTSVFHSTNRVSSP